MDDLQTDVVYDKSGEKLLLKVLYEAMNIRIQDDSSYFDLLKDVLVEVCE